MVPGSHKCEGCGNSKELHFGGLSGKIAAFTRLITSKITIWFIKRVWNDDA
jgi:hypothetical protein